MHRAVSGNRSILLIGAIVAAITFLMFLFICVLKHSLAFIQQLLFSVSIFLALLSTYLLFGYTAAPYFVLGVRRLSMGIILVSSTLYLPRNAFKTPILFIVSAIAGIASILAFLSPFITAVGTYSIVCTTYIVLAFLCLIAIYGFTIYDVIKAKPLGLRLNGTIAGILLMVAIFNKQTPPLMVLSPVVWLCMGMLGITLVLGFREFISAETRNRYLTMNLGQEVARQTQNLKALIADRDKILMYVSHDMKKTVVGMNNSLIDLRQKIETPELISKVDNLLQKNLELKKDFADLGKFGKQNYIAEQSEVMDVSQIMRRVTDELRPDCEANGILLTVTLPKELLVYAKKLALESVIINLVLNAIEHSYCTHLEVNVAKRKGVCRIDIVDDGRGVVADRDIFEPYVSGEASENNSGLGLFLARSSIESMHGELTYVRTDNKTIFSATLPLA